MDISQLSIRLWFCFIEEDGFYCETERNRIIIIFYILHIVFYITFIHGFNTYLP